MTLPTRTLGTSPLEITTVGFGAWAVGGGYAFGWGRQDDEQSVAAIRHAVELGVNWVDTAAVYGLGHSEEVVGRVMRSLPETSRPLIFTKCGLEWDPAEPSREWHEVTPDTVRRGVEDSLRRLGLDRIDLFQIHSPDDNGSPVEPAWEAMLELKHEGLVRAVGVSNFDVGLLDRCEALGHVDSLQPPFSLISRDTATDLLPWAAAHGTGVICYSPMKNGILTDSFGRERIARMAEDDWRRSAPNFREPALGRNLALRDALRPIAERHNATVADVAVAWVLAWPGVSGAIVGGRAPEQVDGWVGAGGLTLSSADLDEIAAAVESTSAGSGPARPRR